MARKERAGRAPGPHGSKASIALRAVGMLAVVVAVAVPAGATAEQASEPPSPVAGQLDAGGQHTCALNVGDVRCWGAGTGGQLGYGDEDSIGDNETPGAVGPVDLGPGRFATAISAGDFHTCALLDNGTVRCWGFGADGRLGYGNTNDVGDDESPGSVGPVNLGVGRTAKAISAGGAHTCAVLNTGSVLCWGFGEDGRLGYGDQATIGDGEAPGSLAPVDLGPGRTATAISAGDAHTCALLDDKSVRCWGTRGALFGGDGRLGYGNADTIGDDETPGSVDPVGLGAGATAISAGGVHTCAVLEDGGVRCWGNGVDGRLGYGNERAIGDNETPGSVGPVDLGGPATAISAGNHTCARLSSGTVRCWGPGALGRLGYANTNDIGDDEAPRAVGPVDLGRPAAAISAGGSHTCARLADATLRCWGEGRFGRLGYGNEGNIGDDETPAAAGPLGIKTRALIDDVTVREKDSGKTTATLTVRLSSASREAASVDYATADESALAPSDYTALSGTLTFAPGDASETITLEVKGDAGDEPDERFRVNLSNPTNLTIADSLGTVTIIDEGTSLGSTPAPVAPVAPFVPLVPVAPVSPLDPADQDAAALEAQALRTRGLRACRAKARGQARRKIQRAGRLAGPRRARAKRNAERDERKARGACVKRWGRTPGRVTGLRGRAVSATKIVLTFNAAGTDGSRGPTAQAYLVKQSTRPIRSAREFQGADSLCGGGCRFPTVARVGSTITLTVDELRPRTTYQYSVAARDNVSGRPGPRSGATKVRTR